MGNRALAADSGRAGHFVVGHGPGAVGRHLARNEAQVAIYGTLLVLMLAGVSGCLMGDRELMPEAMQQLSLVTPQAWALLAYNRMDQCRRAQPVHRRPACAVLSAFGVGFIFLAWCFLRLDEQS